MKRKILIAVLGLGTVLGYGAGFASLRCRAAHRREAFERHVASVCVDAARGERNAVGEPPGREPAPAP